jgi:hypothetical protein
VFGVWRDEYLEYALANRKEWKGQSQAVVAELIETSAKMSYDHDSMVV